MRGRIYAVGRNIDFYYILVLHAIILGSGSTRSRKIVAGDDDNAIMRCSDTYLVFSANHTHGFDTANLGFLYDKFLVAIIKHSAHGGYNNCLSGCNIGRTANYLFGIFTSKVNGGDVQVVAIGVLDTRQHLAYNDTTEAATYSLHSMNAFTFKPYGGQRSCQLFG